MPLRANDQSRRAFGFGCAIVLLTACGETGPSAPRPPASVANVTGVPLVGTAGQVLSDQVVVRVADAAQSPLEGVTVTFAATAGGGSVSPASAVTDTRGEARTRWTLGRTLGSNILTVSAGGGPTVQIPATVSAGRPATVAISGGNNQTAAAGTAVPTVPAVVVRDANSNVVDGATVFFTVLTGGGRVSQPAGRTNAQGVANAGVWILGSSTGTQSLSAQVTEPGVTGNPIVFTATATAGTPSVLVALSPTTQTAGVGTFVASPPSVQVRDGGGNPVPNVQVSFAVTQGGGQAVGGTQTTDAQGNATVGGWRMGNTAGANRLTANVSGVPALTFAATATAGAPFAILVSAGDGQSAPIGRPTPVAPEARVVDAVGNGVAGVAVTFGVGLGGGAAVVGRQVTDAAGIAAVGAWFMGPTPGINTLIASSSGLTSLTFTATATSGPPVVMQAVSLVAQGGISGQPAGSRPSVVIRDAQGTPAAGVAVTFAVSAGGGALSGGAQVTGSDGIATVTAWTLGPLAGVNTVVATSPGLASVTFTATTTGVPTQVFLLDGANQAAVQGSAVPIDPAVRVTDISGLGVSGVVVTFIVTSGGGSVTGSSVLTDVTGAAAVGSWVLGAGAVNTLSATAGAGGVNGNPVTFTAISATQITVTTQPPASPGSGTNFNVTVQLKDASGAVLVPLALVPLTISISPGQPVGGVLNPGGTGLTVNTSGTGTVTFNVNMTGTAGGRTLQISSAGLTTATTNTVTIP